MVISCPRLAGAGQVEPGQRVLPGGGQRGAGLARAGARRQRRPAVHAAEPLPAGGVALGEECQRLSGRWEAWAYAWPLVAAGAQGLASQLTLVALGAGLGLGQGLKGRRSG